MIGLIRLEIISKASRTLAVIFLIFSYKMKNSYVKSVYWIGISIMMELFSCNAHIYLSPSRTILVLAMVNEIKNNLLNLIQIHRTKMIYYPLELDAKCGNESRMLFLYIIISIISITNLKSVCHQYLYCKLVVKFDSNIISQF